VLLALLITPAILADPIHHELVVQLDPLGHSLNVEDSIDLSGLEPDEDGIYHFVLHAGLEPEVITKTWRIKPAPDGEVAPFVGINDAADESQVPLESWQLTRKRKAGDTVILRYGGELNHPIELGEDDYQRGFSETPGTIEERGVYLGGASAWVPDFGPGLITYGLEVQDLTPAWDVVTQGERTVHALPEGRREVRWEMAQPTEEAHLIAGPFTETTVELDGLTFRAFLREPDPGLAHRFAEATRRYATMYEGLLGPYPYPSFALAENFWETGYGMPGFTLLGSKVMRFPWILASSYPHELLHNWWGNSVYVDYASGNWCEGITSYMADHLISEQKGEAALYRRTSLKKYDDFVGGGDDFPLAEFGARSSAASEAVGYGKSMMLQHMVRRAMGDEAYIAALAEFYAKHQWTEASWTDMAQAFEAHQPGTSAFMQPWIERTGAPQLRIASAEVHVADAHPWVVALELEQAQSAEPFPLQVPVAVTMAGVAEPAWHVVACAEVRCKAVLPCEAEPLRLDVDPMFDLMRDLDPHEVPPALSTVQGDPAALFVLPSAASAEELEAWKALATAWEPEAEQVLDSELEALPAHGVWVLGYDNSLGIAVQQAIGAQGVMVGEDMLQVGAEVAPRKDHSLVVVGRAPSAPSAAWAWVAAEPLEAIPGLIRKLPHYSKYGYLAFEGDEPTNVMKGMWEAQGSPLTVNLSDGPLVPFTAPERAALAELPPRFQADALGAWVDRLADPELKGRGLGSSGLRKAQAEVGQALLDLPLEGAGDTDGYRHRFDLGDRPVMGGPALFWGENIVARIPGSDPALADDPILVMAHIDHLGLGEAGAPAERRGKVHPGADDNASGVAVLLGLAGAMAAEPPRARPVVFAVTSAEEVGALGSRALVASMSEAGTPPFACLNLDSVGRLSTGRLYVLNADSAREWRFIMMGVGYTTGIDVAIVPEPLDASDDAACLDAGIPAVQLFTGPHSDYHEPTDTADKVDRAGLAAVAEAAYQTVDYLAQRQEPLTISLDLAARGGEQATATAGHPGGGHPGGGHPGGQPGARKVSLGTMPDFAFAGPGVKVQEVREDSPAAAAGIQAGDVLLSVDGAGIQGLRELGTALRKYSAGDTVTVHLRRGEQELDVQATLEEN
jgi:aminopeptidase N